MFVNCPSCRGLVATDPATDEPPERCPRCAARIRGTTSAAAPADDARSGVAAAIAEHVGAQDAAAAATANPAEDRSAQPAISIATLLQAEPAREGRIGPEAGVDGVPGASGADRVDAGPATTDARPPERPAAVATPPAAAPAPPSAPPEPGPEPRSDPDRSSDRAPDPGSPVALPSDPEPAPIAPAASAEPAAPAVPAAPAAPTGRADRRAAPGFVRRARRDATAPAPARRWAMSAGIAALSLLLALQWLLADRARLAADRTWRPVVERTCALLRCTLPPWHEPAAFTLLERDVRPHPAATDALRVTASFRNDAAWPQAWPQVVLTLSDVDGHPLGMRAFTAAEYLGGEPPSPLLAGGQGAVIRLDVLEPGQRAVGFAFEFR